MEKWGLGRVGNLSSPHPQEERLEQMFSTTPTAPRQRGPPGWPLRRGGCSFITNREGGSMAIKVRQHTGKRWACSGYYGKEE
jgi:hypothetical protein